MAVVTLLTVLTGVIVTSDLCNRVQSNPLNGSPPDNDSIGLLVQYYMLIGPTTESLSGLDSSNK